MRKRIVKALLRTLAFLLFVLLLTLILNIIVDFVPFGGALLMVGVFVWVFYSELKDEKMKGE